MVAKERRTNLDPETLRRFIAMYTDPKVEMKDLEEVFNKKAGTLYRWGFEYNLKRPKVMGQTMLKLELVEKYCRKVSAALLPISELQPAPMPPATKGAVDFVLILGDLHCGSHTKTFNTPTLVARLKGLLEAVQVTTAMYLHKYSRGLFHLHLVGDMVTGERVGYQTTLEELEHAVLTQVYGIAVPRLVQFIRALLTMWQLRIVAAPGNHGVVGKPAVSAANWDTVVYLAVQAQLSNQQGVEFDIATADWYNFDTVQGLDWLITHGDAIRGGNPHGKVGQAATSWHEALAEHFDYISMGHWHELNKIRETFISGCMTTDDDWSRKVVKKDGDCAYWLLAVVDKRIIGAHPLALGHITAEDYDA
jgi:hypothetical protein